MGQIGVSSNGVLARLGRHYFRFAYMSFSAARFSSAASRTCLHSPLNGNGKVYFELCGLHELCRHEHELSRDASRAGHRKLGPLRAGKPIMGWRWSIRMAAFRAHPSAMTKLFFSARPAQMLGSASLPGFDQITPDVSLDFLITSPVGFTGEDTSIAPYNHPSARDRIAGQLRVADSFRDDQRHDAEGRDVSRPGLF